METSGRSVLLNNLAESSFIYDSRWPINCQGSIILADFIVIKRIHKWKIMIGGMHYRTNHVWLGIDLMAFTAFALPPRARCVLIYISYFNLYSIETSAVGVCSA